MSGESLIILPRAYQSGAILGHRPSTFDASKPIPIEVDYARNCLAYRRDKTGIWVEQKIGMPRLHWNVGATEATWLGEDGATNSVVHSMDFSNAAWAVIGTATKAPSSLPTNIKDVVPYDIAGLGVAGVNFFYQSLGNNTDCTYQCFIRATEPSDVGKTIRLTSNAGLSVSIVLTLDWQEYVVFAAGALNNQFMLSTGATGTPATKCTISYCGIINRLNATSPIKTAGSSVSRVGDNPSLTGLISKGILSSTGGTYYIELNNVKTLSGGTSWYIGGSSSNKITFGGQPSIANTLTIWLYNGGVETYVGNTPTGTKIKMCFVFSPTQLKIFGNGALLFTITQSLNVHLWTELQALSMVSWIGGIGKQWFKNIQADNSEAIAATTL